MTDPVEGLRALVESPPSPPAPLEELQRRAQTRRARRAAGAGLAAVVAVAVAVPLLNRPSDRAVKVVTTPDSVPGTTTSTTRARFGTDGWGIVAAEGRVVALAAIDAQGRAVPETPTG